MLTALFLTVMIVGVCQQVNLGTVYTQVFPARKKQAADNKL